MRTQHSVSTSRGFSRTAILVLVAIVGFLVVIIWLMDNVSGPPTTMPYPLSQLQTIRHQIELYNVLNPETPYDATTPVGSAFWDPLVENNYLATAPRNPAWDNSSLVVASPIAGAGWVWAEHPRWGSVNIMAIDPNGNLLDRDNDGWPD